MANKQLVGYLLVSVIPYLHGAAFAADANNSDFSDVYNVTEADNLVSDKSTKVESSINQNSDFIYTVPFDGDIDKAHSVAFDKLVTKLSGGVMRGKDVKFDIDSIISDENILDEGLQVIFDENLAKKMVSDGLIVVWNGLSEPLLGWIARGNSSQELTSVDSLGNATKTELENGPSIVASDNGDDFTRALIKEGKKNKVQFLLPVNDIDDLSAITLQDVLSNNGNAIKNAASRYTAGNTVSGVLTRGTDGKIYFSYHVYNLGTGTEVFSGDLNGTATEIAKAFYVQLIKHATELSSVGVRKDMTKDASSSADRTVPGMKGNGSAVIQVFGLNDDATRKKAVDELYGIGIADVVMRPIGNSVYFDLTFKDDFDCSAKLSTLKNLKGRTEPFVFDYADTISTSGNNVAGEMDKSPASNEKNTYNTEQSTDIETSNRDGGRQRRNNSAKYPDPNKVLHTGGGLGSN